MGFRRALHSHRPRRRRPTSATAATAPTQQKQVPTLTTRISSPPSRSVPNPPSRCSNDRSRWSPASVNRRMQTFPTHALQEHQPPPLGPKPSVLVHPSLALAEAKADCTVLHAPKHQAASIESKSPFHLHSCRRLSTVLAHPRLVSVRERPHNLQPSRNFCLRWISMLPPKRTPERHQMPPRTTLVPHLPRCRPSPGCDVALLASSPRPSPPRAC